ncbi:spermidine synthase [Haloferula luteola]|uniref:Spermidine synthase n=1 Tax=Haloferula luteola TaxID=595692 RepID=A0A840VDW0_9BACT|nr:spermidine synthase [Haloferula luteola]
MKPYINLAEARLADGTVFSLHQHDGMYYLKNDGRELMSTRMTYSEQLLADWGCEGLAEGHPRRPAHPKVLIGGLGMGFTLKRALEVVGHPATVEVAELMPEIIAWNRTFLAEHNGPILEDGRTRIHQGDLFECLGKYGKGSLDALLVDIDDGPDMLITEGNSRLYSPSFFAKVREVLKANACAAYWMAHPTPEFERKLVRAGFQVEAIPVKAHEKAKKPRHCIYVARNR